MKRLHLHVSVDDLSESIRFYKALFATEPTVVKPDYAKWMLEDPRVNFAISARGQKAGLDHLGIQAETSDELAQLRTCLESAGRPMLEESAATCCYSRSKKTWTTDPQGLAWETFLTSGDSTVYGDNIDLGPIRTNGGCC